MLVAGNFEVDGRLPLKPGVIVGLERQIVGLWWYNLVGDWLVRMCGIELLFLEMRYERMAELLDVRRLHCQNEGTYPLHDSVYLVNSHHSLLGWYLFYSIERIECVDLQVLSPRL